MSGRVGLCLSPAVMRRPTRARCCPVTSGFGRSGRRSGRRSDNPLGPATQSSRERHLHRHGIPRPFRDRIPSLGGVRRRLLDPQPLVSAAVTNNACSTLPPRYTGFRPSSRPLRSPVPSLGHCLIKDKQHKSDNNECTAAYKQHRYCSSDRSNRPPSPGRLPTVSLEQICG